MLFFNVLLLCVIGTPVLAAVIPQGDLQIRSPRDGQLRSASRLERRIESDPIKNWLQKAGIGIQGTWYLSGEVTDKTWENRAIELGSTKWPPSVYDLTREPGELKEVKDFKLTELPNGPWRRMPYRKGFKADDMMTYTHERGFELFSELSALKAPPPISGPERIHFHSLIGPGVTTGPAYHITEYFWYGIEDDNRNILMRIREDDLSLTFFKLPDEAGTIQKADPKYLVQQMKREDVRNHGAGTWRLMPLRLQEVGYRTLELIVTMQKDVPHFDVFGPGHGSQT